MHIRSALLALVVASAPATAGATSDDGDIARLLTFAGANAEYAIVADVPFQSWCPDRGCVLRVYSVPLAGDTFRLVAPLSVPGHAFFDAEQRLRRERLIARYLELVRGHPGAPVAPLSTGGFPISLEPHEGGSVKGKRSDGTWFIVDHVTLRQVPSMSATSALSAEPCTTMQCSTCEDVEHAVGGRTQTGRRCRAEDGTWKETGGPCRCDGVGAIVALRISEAGAGTGPAEGRFFGSQVLVEPYQLMHNRNIRSRKVETTDVAVTSSRLSARETVRGAVIVTGALAHEPLGNGTLLPVVGILPPGNRVQPPRDLTVTSPAATVSTAVPMPSSFSPPSTPRTPPPPHGGCGSCFAAPPPSASSAPSLLWLLSLVVHSVRRWKR